MMYTTQISVEKSPNVFFFKPDFQTFGRVGEPVARLEYLSIPAEPDRYRTWKALAPTNLGFWSEE